MRLVKLAVVLGLVAWAWVSIPGFAGSVGAAASSVVSTAGAAVSGALPVSAATSASREVSAGWVSCGPVPFVVSVDRVPQAQRPELVREARRAFRVVSQASGVVFRFAGVVAADAMSSWPASDQRVDGYGFAPVLVSWVPVSASDMLTQGQWGSTVLALQPSGRAVSAVVALNLDELDRLRPGFGAGATRGSVLLHELGHVVGLEHGEAGLMTPVVGPDSPEGFGEAELAALREAAPACS